MSADDFAAYLDEPCPCDDCQYADLCASTGAACKSFSAYQQGKYWKNQRREPDLDIGRRLGLVNEENIAQLREAMLK